MKNKYRYDEDYGNVLYLYYENLRGYVAVGKFPGLTEEEAIELYEKRQEQYEW